MSCILGFWVALDSYTAKSHDELTYRAGEEIEVLATSNFGWWKIRCVYLLMDILQFWKPKNKSLILFQFMGWDVSRTAPASV